MPRHDRRIAIIGLVAATLSRLSPTLRDLTLEISNCNRRCAQLLEPQSIGEKTVAT